MKDGRFVIRAELEKNRLYFAWRGELTYEQVQSAVDQIMEACHTLQPGFAVVNDISQLRPVSPAGLSEIKRLQISLHERGVGRVVRVISEKNVVTQMQFISMGAQTYTIATHAVTTLAEAEAWLDQEPAGGQHEH